MVERIEEMPPGTIGLRSTGKLTADDYRDVMEPALQEAIEGGEARVLFVIDDYDGLEPSAAIEDIKTGLKVEVLHRDAWKRVAVVTDEDWIAEQSRRIHSGAGQIVCAGNSAAAATPSGAHQER